MATGKKLELKAEKRKITGRKVKQLRKEGILPANIYGKDVKSLAIQVPAKEFQPVFKEAGETGLLDLLIAGEDKTRPVLIHNLQLDPVTDTALHVDFHQVSLKEKITAKIPLVLVGEAPIVKEKAGILIQPVNEIEVKALPTELPEKIEVAVGGLKAVGEGVTVADLKIPAAVELLTGKDQLVVKIEPLAKKEEVAPPPAEAVPPAEGEPAEPAGEGKAEEGKPEETKPAEKKPAEAPSEQKAPEAPKPGKEAKLVEEKK